MDWSKVRAALRPVIVASMDIFLFPGRKVDKEQAKTAALRAAGTCTMCEEAPAEPGRDECYVCEISWKR